MQQNNMAKESEGHSLFQTAIDTIGEVLWQGLGQADSKTDTEQKEVAEESLGQVGSETELTFGAAGNVMGGGLGGVLGNSSAFDSVDMFAQGLADKILNVQHVTQDWHVPGGKVNESEQQE